MAWFWAIATIWLAIFSTGIMLGWDGDFVMPSWLALALAAISAGYFVGWGSRVLEVTFF